MAMETSAIPPDAGGTNSAALTLQKDGKSMEVARIARRSGKRNKL
jgi:hypothetical protein